MLPKWKKEQSFLTSRNGDWKRPTGNVDQNSKAPNWRQPQCDSVRASEPEAWKEEKRFDAEENESTSTDECWILLLSPCWLSTGALFLTNQRSLRAFLTAPIRGVGVATQPISLFLYQRGGLDAGVGMRCQNQPRRLVHGHFRTPVVSRQSSDSPPSQKHAGTSRQFSCILNLVRCTCVPPSFSTDVSLLKQSQEQTSHFHGSFRTDIRQIQTSFGFFEVFTFLTPKPHLNPRRKFLLLQNYSQDEEAFSVHVFSIQSYFGWPQNYS